MITDKLLQDSWEKVNLAENNTRVGDTIRGLNGLFATLASITPKGLYSVRYDMKKEKNSKRKLKN